MFDIKIVPKAKEKGFAPDKSFIHGSYKCIETDTSKKVTEITATRDSGEIEIFELTSGARAYVTNEKGGTVDKINGMG